MTSILLVNAIELVGLKQTAYISRSLVKGQSREDIVKSLDADTQLVDMWILFLKHNHWMDMGLDGKWSLTAKGQEWISR
jgi:hypothetical protein